MSINSNTDETRSLLDKTAGVLSAICLLHCLALPIVLLLGIGFVAIIGSFI